MPPLSGCRRAAFCARRVFTAEVGQRINEAELKAFLVRMGFTQAPTVMEPGDYAVRGGIIDVYPPGESGAGSSGSFRGCSGWRAAL